MLTQKVKDWTREQLHEQTKARYVSEDLLIERCRKIDAKLEALMRHLGLEIVPGEKFVVKSREASK